MYAISKHKSSQMSRSNICYEDIFSWLNLHMQGIEMFKSGPQHKYDTRPGATPVWREKEVAKKLHFTMENKLKIIQYLQKTFQNNAKGESPQ